MAHVLLVEDNASIREAAAEYLKLDGHQVSELETGAGVIELAAGGGVELVILDVMLPKASGFSLAREIRRFSRVPIIFLTARDAESDRIIGFELGGDDYIVKPFSPKELVLRVKAVLRRTGQDHPDTPQQDVREYCREDRHLSIDRKAHTAHLNGTELSLTSTEWELLLYLAEHPGQVFPRDTLLQTCLGYSPDGATRTVDTHIGNLRTKLEHDPWIETIRGYGYRFSGQPAGEDDG